jgi:hypothetical protein
MAPSSAVGLNHFYVILDHDTFTAIESNAFLKEQFAVFEKRTTVRTDKTYTGIYFYGHQTYFEMLDATSADASLGHAGIAFGDDGNDGNVEPRGKSPIEGVTPQLVTRGWNGLQVPWFFMTSQPLKRGEEQGFATWFMQYHPDFLAKWHPEARPSSAEEPTRRARVLERYKAVLPAVASQPLLGDVTALTLAAKAESRIRFEAWRAAIGSTFPVKLVDPGAGSEGIRAAEFRLDRAPAKEETLRFGAHSTLTLHRESATWQFE